MPVPGMPPAQDGAAGMPPQLGPAPAKISPAMAPQGQQGNVAAAMSDIKNAIQMLQKALPLLPFGSEEHQEIITFLGKIGKHVGKGGNDNPGLDMQSLLQMAKQNAESAPQKAMMRMFPPAAPNSPPAQPEAQPQA